MLQFGALEGQIKTNHAAPTTDSEMLRPMPRLAHMYGDVSVKIL